MLMMTIKRNSASVASQREQDVAMTVVLFPSKI
jgi:hypothetical protein